jgi:ribosomal protein L9
VDTGWARDFSALWFIAQKNTAAATKELEEFTRLATNTAANREKIDDAKKRIDQLRAAGK